MPGSLETFPVGEEVTLLSSPHLPLSIQGATLGCSWDAFCLMPLSRAQNSVYSTLFNPHHTRRVGNLLPFTDGEAHPGRVRTPSRTRTQAY